MLHYTTLHMLACTSLLLKTAFAFSMEFISAEFPGHFRTGISLHSRHVPLRSSNILVILELWHGTRSYIKIITIHHERPCRIEISHPRGRKFNQGRGLPSPWLNSDPEGEISLSYMDRLMMDRFSPTFRRVFVRT